MGGLARKSKDVFCFRRSLHYITTNLHQKKTVVAIFIDMKKAFDAVNKRKMMDKLTEMGLKCTYIFRNHKIILT